MDHAHPTALKLRQHDPSIGTDRLRGIGYSWECSCGSRGGRYASWAMARYKANEHQLSHRAQVTAHEASAATTT